MKTIEYEKLMEEAGVERYTDQSFDAGGLIWDTGVNWYYKDEVISFAFGETAVLFVIFSPFYTEEERAIAQDRVLYSLTMAKNGREELIGMLTLETFSKVVEEIQLLKAYYMEIKKKEELKNGSKTL